MTRQEMEKWSCTRSPVVVFQHRSFKEFCWLCPSRAEDGSCAQGEAYQYTCEKASEQVLVWVSERVFADVDEADAWRKQQPYRFPDEQAGRTWRYWAVPAEGRLEGWLKRVDMEEQAEACTTNGRRDACATEGGV